ncbi:hypothetical protein INS49_005501 [Diaporthe citri]|uniref:uncharacterized protein n=1 Tax=Diaporthe citri TaxID=83186 RepID=UPI001C806F46|nr:uncharacterized protein INS49_005501 [Diaporthe citri]KAG6353539.1 hypothetical protein INS49_005501 [Diaporthe citri]
MAVLIIAHAETEVRARFKNWIGRLEVDWMMATSPDSLDTQQGFWKGLNSGNLITIFDINFEQRTAEVPFAADYTQAFGPSFFACRRDLRPFEELEQWLLGQLSEEGEVKTFSTWYTHWETKIDGAENF